MTISRTGIVVLLLTAVVVLTGWWRKLPSGNGNNTQISASRQADYFLEDFQVHQFDENGRIRYQLRGRRLDHFTDDQNSYIQNPVIFVHPDTPTAADWRIQASQAKLPARIEGDILFDGRATARNDGAADPVSLDAHSIIVSPQAKLMRAEGNVVLATNGVVISADRLDANLNDEQYRLDGVRSRYAP